MNVVVSTMSKNEVSEPSIEGSNGAEEEGLTVLVRLLLPSTVCWSNVLPSALIATGWSATLPDGAAVSAATASALTCALLMTAQAYACDTSEWQRRSDCFIQWSHTHCSASHGDDDRNS